MQPENNNRRNNILKHHPDQEYAQEAKSRVWKMISNGMEMKKRQQERRFKLYYRITRYAAAACLLTAFCIYGLYDYKRSSHVQASLQTFVIEPIVDTLDASIQISPGTKKSLDTLAIKYSEAEDSNAIIIKPYTQPRHESLRTLIQEQIDTSPTTKDIYYVVKKDTLQKVRQRVQPLSPHKKHMVTDNEIFALLQYQADHKVLKKETGTDDSPGIFKPAVIKTTYDSISQKLKP